MRANEFIKETASAGATTSGNVAVVVNPAVARSKKKPKMQKPTDNALDGDVSLFGGEVIKRNSKKPLATL
jgi:hypothetical protein